MIKFIVSFGIALALEIMALACLAKTGDGNYPMLLKAGWLHMAGLLAGGVSIWLCLPECLRKRKSTFVLLLLGFGLPMPCIGLLFLTGFGLLLNQRPDEDPAKKYFFGERQVLSPPKFSPLNSEAPRSVLDIMNAKENEPRRRAVLALRNLDPKQSIPVLVKAIQDSDEQVRLLAQAQFDKLTEDLEYGVKKAEIELAKGEASVAKRIHLAEQYHEMVYLGLGSSETESLYLMRAIALLKQALALEPNHPQARFLLLKCCIKNRQVGEAQECLANLKKDGFQAEFLAAWESDVCFQARDWDGLNRILEQMQNRWRADARMGDIIDIWLGPSISNS